MKKIVLAVLLIVISVFAAHQAEGTKVIVKKGDKVVYETPCGNAEIINQLAKSERGLLGGADVEVVGVVNVVWTVMAVVSFVVWRRKYLEQKEAEYVED